MEDDSKVSASVWPVGYSDFVLNAHASPLQEVEIIFKDKKRLHRFLQEERGGGTESHCNRKRIGGSRAKTFPVGPYWKQDALWITMMHVSPLAKQE